MTRDQDGPPASPAPPASPTPPASPSPAGSWGGWQPSPDPGIAREAEKPRTTWQRAAEAVVWVLGVFVVLFLGRITLLFNPSADLSGFERGEIVGRIFGALTLGVVIRWGWIKLRKKGRVLSPWILVIAALALGSSLTRDAAALVPPVGAPIDTYLEIGAPYALGPAAADVNREFVDQFAGSGSTATEVREVLAGDEPIGYVIVANIGTTVAGDFFSGFESGFKQTEGAEANLEVVGGVEALVGTGPAFAVVVWKEPPYAVVVYAADVERARQIATSIMGAYE